MDNVPMKVNIRRLTANKDMFEFTIATPVLRSQFRIPRSVLNQLRVMIEQALLTQ